jgi:uncharacterized protein (TIGR03435 family)
MPATMQRLCVAILLVATIGFSEPPNASVNFEVISVRPCGNGEGLDGGRMGLSTSPGRLSIRCQTVDFLLRQAYLANGRDPLFVNPSLYNQPVKGTPSWVTSSRYTIEAKAAGLPGREVMLGPMTRTLLENRFKLRTHREPKEVPVYALTIAKGDPRLQETREGGCYNFDADNPEPPSGLHICGILVRSVNPAFAPAAFYGATIADLCRGLSRILNREVIDKTGISGRFDIGLKVSNADLFPRAAILARSASPDNPDASANTAEPQGSSVFAALNELGLKLEPSKSTVDFLVIDHIERPSGN